MLTKQKHCCPPRTPWWLFPIKIDFDQKRNEIFMGSNVNVQSRSDYLRMSSGKSMKIYLEADWFQVDQRIEWSMIDRYSIPTNFGSHCENCFASLASKSRFVALFSPNIIDYISLSNFPIHAAKQFLPWYPGWLAKLVTRNHVTEGNMLELQKYRSVSMRQSVITNYVVKFIRPIICDNS